MPINDNRLQHADTMIITCQNCQTNYDIAAEALGGGKTVSCHNCGNTWHQNPVQAPPPVAYAQPAYPQQVPFDAAPAPVPMPEPPAAPAPEAVLAPEPAPEPVPEPEPAPAPEPEPASDIEADAAARAEAALMAEEEEAAADDAGDDLGDALGDDAGEDGGGEDALSTAQLDEMFGEEIDSGVFAGDGDTGDEDEGDAPAGEPGAEPDIEGIPDPDPIPEVFSAGDDDDLEDNVKKGGKGKIIAIAAVVFLLLLGAGLFFGRSYIIDLYPPAGDIFAMIGLGGEELGEGLEFNNIKSAREVEKGVDVMVVRGEIANVSDKERMVPMIRVVLLDGNKEVIQSAVAAPLKNRLPAGATIAFGAKLPEPSALARSLEVTFSAPDK